MNMHETMASKKIETVAFATPDHEYKENEIVMTCDGFPGRIVSVYDGPFRGNEEYEIVLENNLGRGRYTSSQIKGRCVQESDPNLYTADKDYPELSEILQERPDPAKLRFSASKNDSPGLSPLSKVIALGATDKSFRMHLTAAWKDVVAKAKRIRSESKVTIVSASGDTIVGHVQGDNHTYESGIQRTVGSQAVAAWSCGCAWGAYHWGASDDLSRFSGRMCSHALALQYEAQSRGMFGKEITEDETKPKWVPNRVVVKYDIDSGGNMYAHASASLALPPIAIIAHLANQDEQASAIMKSAAVNDLFGNNPVGMPNKEVGPPGATTPKNPYENPASAGYLSGPDPSDWLSVQPTQLNTWAAFDQSSTEISSDVPIENAMPNESHFDVNTDTKTIVAEKDKDEEGYEAELKEEPEAALPDATAYNWDHADPSVLSPEQIDSNGTPTPPSGGVVTSQPPHPNVPEMPEETLSGSNTSDTMNDVIREFHRSTAAQELSGKTAMKNFSFSEQQELINESRGSRARNFDQLDIEGTHYAHINEEEDDQLWLI